MRAHEDTKNGPKMRTATALERYRKSVTRETKLPREKGRNKTQIPLTPKARGKEEKRKKQKEEQGQEPKKPSRQTKA